MVGGEKSDNTGEPETTGSSSKSDSETSDIDDPGRYLELFIGTNPEPYLNFYRKLFPNGANNKPVVVRWSWHWGGFLVPIPWMFYRKLYLWGAGVLLALIILEMVWPAAAKHSAAAFIVFAVGGKRLYVEHALKRIRKILERKLPPKERDELIGKAGGMSIPGAVLGTAIIVAGVVSLFVTLGSGGLPACNARETRELAMQVLEDLAVERGLSTQGLRIEQIEKLPVDLDFLRLCRATAYVAGKSVPVSYKLTWQDEKNGIFQLEMEWK
jgi:hypothetical protein